MRRMYSLNQLIALIEEYGSGGEITPEKVLQALLGQDINVNGITCKGIANTGNIANIGDIAATGDVSGATLSEGTTNIRNLFVKIMPAPESATLTEEEFATIGEGTFINGEYLGLKNPVFLPYIETTSYYRGIVFSGRSIQCYEITKGTTKNISIMAASAPYLNLVNVNAINGLSIPSNPSSSGTFTLKCVNGALTWVDDA